MAHIICNPTEHKKIGTRLNHVKAVKQPKRQVIIAVTPMYQGVKWDILSQNPTEPGGQT
jgi:hypothetical protein